MTSYFVPTGTIKCGDLEVCPEGTMCLRPLLYTEPTICVNNQFNLHEDLIKPPCANMPWIDFAELALLCACLVLLVVLVIMECVRCCRGRVKKSPRHMEMSQLGNLGSQY